MDLRTQGPGCKGTCPAHRQLPGPLGRAGRLPGPPPAFSRRRGSGGRRRWARWMAAEPAAGASGAPSSRGGVLVAKAVGAMVGAIDAEAALLAPAASRLWMLLWDT